MVVEDLLRGKQSPALSACRYMTVRITATVLQAPRTDPSSTGILRTGEGKTTIEIHEHFLAARASKIERVLNDIHAQHFRPAEVEIL